MDAKACNSVFRPGTGLIGKVGPTAAIVSAINDGKSLSFYVVCDIPYWYIEMCILSIMIQLILM